MSKTVGSITEVFYWYELYSVEAAQRAYTKIRQNLTDQLEEQAEVAWKEMLLKNLPFLIVEQEPDTWDDDWKPAPLLANPTENWLTVNDYLGSTNVPAEQLYTSVKAINDEWRIYPATLLDGGFQSDIAQNQVYNIELVELGVITSGVNIVGVNIIHWDTPKYGVHLIASRKLIAMKLAQLLTQLNVDFEKELAGYHLWEFPVSYRTTPELFAHPMHQTFVFSADGVTAFKPSQINK